MTFDIKSLLLSLIHPRQLGIIPFLCLFGCSMGFALCYLLVISFNCIWLVLFAATLYWWMLERRKRGKREKSLPQLQTKKVPHLELRLNVADFQEWVILFKTYRHRRSKPNPNSKPFSSLLSFSSLSFEPKIRLFKP
jgi:hypothetical protein